MYDILRLKTYSCIIYNCVYSNEMWSTGRGISPGHLLLLLTRYAVRTSRAGSQLLWQVGALPALLSCLAVLVGMAPDTAHGHSRMVTATSTIFGVAAALTLAIAGLTSPPPGQLPAAAGCVVQPTGLLHNSGSTGRQPHVRAAVLRPELVGRSNAPKPAPGAVAVLRWQRP